MDDKVQILEGLDGFGAGDPPSRGGGDVEDAFTPPARDAATKAAKGKNLFLVGALFAAGAAIFWWIKRKK